MDDNTTSIFPEFDNPSASPAEKAAEPQRGKILPLILAITAVLAVIAGAIWWFVSSSSTSREEVFVDDSGAQENIPEPVPGEHDDVSEMVMSINGQEAVVDPVQATEDGVLLPPDDVSKLGWYSASAVPGQAGNVGTSVITGHINDVNQGTGYAQVFTTMKKDEEFIIRINGEDRKFKVSEAPEHFGKTDELPGIINETDGDNRVVLVTCGGKFVGGALGYEDNIVLVADPA